MKIWHLLPTVFDAPAKEKEIARLKEKTLLPSFWEDAKEAGIVNKQIKALEEITLRLKTDYETLEFLTLLNAETESELDEGYKELLDGTNNLLKEVENFKILVFLNGKYDGLNAIVTIQAGAGGTEAQDWAEMLQRMYTMYAEKNKFNISVLDYLEGDEAGIKSVTFKVEGFNAYGYLKCEKGVHRLVRISPFDSNKRRHTSFASVEVIPEITERPKIEINRNDLKIDTYRSGGAGGQHVNKTDSACRITHIPTGIVVQCQNERSLIQNKEYAMDMLYAKLALLEEEKERALNKELHGDLKKIEWGSQIRSYVFCPYTLVKDHRSDFETSNVQAVMNGEIQDFINAYLIKSK